MRGRARLPLLLLLSLLLLLPLLAAALMLWLAHDARPRLPEQAPPQWQDIERAKQLLDRHRPGQSAPGTTRAIALTPRDLVLLSDQATRRFTTLPPPRLRVDLGPGRARLQASLASPLQGRGLGLDGWFNIDATLHETATLPEIERLHIGRLPLPSWLAERALPWLLPALKLQQQGELAQRMISRVQFTPQLVVVAFAWPAHGDQLLADTLLPRDEQARLEPYVRHIAGLGTARQAARGLSLAEVLPSLFALSAQRSAQGQPAARENRAALLALTLLTVHPSALARLAPASRQWGMAWPLRLTLQGRGDLAMHFLVSAVVAAEAGNPLADAVGVYKEVADSRGGSGFSFNDLAADRAGTRFGRRLVGDAAELQQRLAAGVQEGELLPPVDDLPEFMPEREFLRRFGGVGAPAYREMMASIEARLDRLPLLALR